MELDRADVVVIGGGVSGLSSAWWLARGGVNVVLVEKGIVGWEASGRNGGQMGHRGKEGADGLAIEEVKLWPQMDELLGYPTEWTPGLIRISLTEEEMVQERQYVSNQRGLGADTELLDAATVREWIPQVSPSVQGAAFTATGGHANPQRLVQAFAWAIQDLGGRIYQHAKVTGITVTGDKVTSVETERGAISTDFVVSAAGPQTGLIADMVGVFVPIAPARVEILVTAPLPPMWSGFVFGNLLYGRQTLRGNLAYGGGTPEWMDIDLATPEKPNTPQVRNISRRLAELLPGSQNVPVIRSWAGVVEQTPDYSPIIDVLDHPSNFAVVTLSGDGFGLSPATGKAVSEMVMHGESTIPLDQMSLRRFADVPRDWREERGWAPGPERH